MDSQEDFKGLPIANHEDLRLTNMDTLMDSCRFPTGFLWIH